MTQTAQGGRTSLSFHLITPRQQINSADYAYCKQPSYPGESPLLPPAMCGHGTAVCCLPNENFPNGALAVCVHGTGTIWEVCAAGTSCVPGWTGPGQGANGCQGKASLSGGQIAGIVVGIVVATMLVFLLIFFGFRTWRRNRASRESGIATVAEIKN